MRTVSIFGWPKRQQSAESLINADATSLLDIWGEAAHAVAADLSWREDSGLLHSSNPGHWSRVQSEIGRRLGVGNEPTFQGGLSAAA
jgi:hypothetical protein